MFSIRNIGIKSGRQLILCIYLHIPSVDTNAFYHHHSSIHQSFSAEICADSSSNSVILMLISQLEECVEMYAID